MQVTLKQSEIEAAVKGYIAKQGISLVGKSISVAFTAGRGEAGISASIDIEANASDLAETVINRAAQMGGESHACANQCIKSADPVLTQAPVEVREVEEVVEGDAPIGAAKSSTSLFS